RFGAAARRLFAGRGPKSAAGFGAILLLRDLRSRCPCDPRVRLLQQRPGHDPGRPHRCHRPLQVIKVLSKVPPGQGGQLIVSLGTPRKLGEYEGAIEISFKNKDLAPLRLSFTGRITPVIEVRPFPAFFVATTRGGTNGASLEIVNKD